MDFAPIETEIQAMALEMYEGRFGPTHQQWNMYRSVDLPTARRLIKEVTGAEGRINPNRHSWGAVLAKAGLAYPPHGLLIKMAKRRAAELEEQPPALAGNLNGKFYCEGLPVMRWSRPVIQWDVRTHRYVTVSERVVLMVR